MRVSRPAIGSTSLSVLVTAYVLIFLNVSFWEKTSAAFSGNRIEGIPFPVAFVALFLACVISLSMKYVVKPVLITMIMVSTLAAYFVDSSGVLITRDMIENTVASTTNEARQFLTVQLFLHIVFYGLVPSALVAWTRVVHQTFYKKLRSNSLVVFPCLLLCLAILFLNYAGIASSIRERPDMMESTNPGGPITSAVKFSYVRWRDHNVVVRPLGTDAHKGSRALAANKPLVMIVVAGETARAKNFSLNGYDRDTNPETRAANVINFPNATSCGTATAVSLPRMFSVYPRVDYSDRKSRSTENLMDVLKHAGVSGEWWDNNTGSKGVADRIKFVDMSHGPDPANCQENECRDQIMVDRLGSFLDGVRGDTVLVLHQLGSHGPSYYLRYPPAFAKFKPDCRSAHLTDCSSEEIVNAYDNTILFTDHFLAQVISSLEQHADRLDTAMIYMSDHGESLGEDGLYLHGAPYMFAPTVQTHIPFLTWISGSFATSMGIDTECMRAKTDQPVSHDNLFHSVLGLMDIVTSIYDIKLDIFASCRTPPPAMQPIQG